MLKTLYVACGLFLIGLTVRSQNTFTKEQETFYRNAMTTINSKHIAWIKTTATNVNKQKLDETAVRKLATNYATLGNLNGADIEALCFLVLMDAAKSAQDDIKNIMAATKAINNQKDALRQMMSSTQKLENSNAGISKQTLDSFRFNLRSVTPNNVQTTNRTTSVPVQRVNVMTTQKASSSDINQFQNELKHKTDSLNSLSEIENLQLQMMMDKQGKMITVLSNIMKKISDTQDNIIKNMK